MGHVSDLHGYLFFIRIRQPNFTRAKALLSVVSRLMPTWVPFSAEMTGPEDVGFIAGLRGKVSSGQLKPGESWSEAWSRPPQKKIHFQTMPDELPIQRESKHNGRLNKNK